MSDSGNDEKSPAKLDNEVVTRDAATVEAANLTDQTMVRSLLRKTDLLVMSGFCLAYFTNVLDRQRQDRHY